MRILAVDDDPVILDLLPVALMEQGYTNVTTARSGAAALALLESADVAFEVLILDISMPEMDGVTLCRRIRRLAAYQATPIIVLTANADILTIESAFGAGANDYITKPFDIKAIGTRVQIAERMMRDACETFVVGSQANALDDNTELNGLNIEDPFKISGLSQHTDIFSLGNYLSQLARTKVDKTSVFALQICDFESIFSYCSGDELLYLLSEVANAVSWSTKNRSLLGAYNGSGAFIYIAPDDMNDEWPAMEACVSEYLRNSGLLGFMKHHADASVVIGRPFRPNASKTNRVRPTFERALTAVERRTQAMEQSERPMNSF